MIYTCFEMIRDCRANRPEGWLYFISSYAPVIQRLVAHYRPKSGVAVGEVLLVLRNPQSSLFESIEPAPERWFVSAMRQHVLVALDSLTPLPVPELAIELETLATALEPLTVVEKQAVWLEAMLYGLPEAGALLRTSPQTIEKMRETAAERIRSTTDQWSTALLAHNGRQLGIAAQTATAQCLPAQAFLDLLDGRTTWQGREELERHVHGCWHCIDHSCRMMETVALLRHLQPLSDAEAEPYRQLLGIARPKRPAWKRLFGTG